MMFVNWLDKGVHVYPMKYLHFGVCWYFLLSWIIKPTPAHVPYGKNGSLLNYDVTCKQK